MNIEVGSTGLQLDYFFKAVSAITYTIGNCGSGSSRGKHAEFDILPGPPKARGFLTLHRDALQVVLSSLCVRLKSWRYPIPTWAIFLAAFSSRSWCVPQLRQISFLIERSSLPHLNPHSEHSWLGKLPPIYYPKIPTVLIAFSLC